MSESQPEGSESEERSTASVTDERADADSSFVELSEQFYRGEIDRVTTWRTRMDQTTNWAVVVMAAILTWAFSSPDNPHYVLLIGVLSVGVFLFIEAQRYQEYDAWRGRIRVLQRNLFAEQYRAEGPEYEGWRDWLSDDLRHPRIQISLVAAIGHRLQHVYFPLLTVLLAAWTLRISVFESKETWRETASIADVSGVVVVGIVALSYLLLAGLTVRSIRRDFRREFEG